MPLAKCTRRCWDAEKTRRYYPGDRDDLDPKSPIAAHFVFDDPKVEKVKQDFFRAIKEEKKAKGKIEGAKE